MSKLSALQGKKKTFTIGPIELDINPLTMDELGLFNIDKNSSAKEQMEATQGLISKVLKDSVPDATDDEIKNIGTKYLEPLMNAIMEVNGFSEQKINLIKKKIQQ